jgi:hypothetical protein
MKIKILLAIFTEIINFEFLKYVSRALNKTFYAYYYYSMYVFMSLVNNIEFRTNPHVYTVAQYSVDSTLI